MLDLHRLVAVFIVGLAEGLTEFLPISSTGHLILVKNLLNNTYDVDYVLIIVVQLGAVFSIVLLFWRRLYRMSIVCMMNLLIKRHYKSHHLCLLHILLGTLPGVVLGIFCFERIRSIFDLMYVVYGLIIGGIFLLVAEQYLSRVPPHTLCIDNITYVQAFLIGCFQCLAFFPGFSRSGATVGGGLLVGLNRRTSLEFSFFLAIPIICGATILTLYHCGVFIVMRDSIFLLIGCIVAFCVAILIVRLFLRIVQNISFFPFAMYRFILAGSIYWLLIT